MKKNAEERINKAAEELSIFSYSCFSSNPLKSSLKALSL